MFEFGWCWIVAATGVVAESLYFFLNLEINLCEIFLKKVVTGYEPMSCEFSAYFNFFL